MTSLWSISNAGAAFRGIDPKGITVYILPSSRVRGIGEGANITWTDVKDGFEELPSRLSTKYTVLENSQAIEDKGLVLVGSPFAFGIPNLILANHLNLDSIPTIPFSTTAHTFPRIPQRHLDYTLLGL